ncbi:MAG TPA: SAM-dependent methyltransferase [Burkholderiaceae bacterium]|nr:SAM-dependent methyltransferase [Burkholderiaceae bacterium]
MQPSLFRSTLFPVFRSLTWATLAMASMGAAQARPALDVPYIKTPDAVVDRMLEMGKVGPDDFLIDLGSGDGRIPITAAVKHGTRALGVDLDPARTQEARAGAEQAGVADRVSFRTENLFDTDLSEATVITMYLFPEINLRLRPELLKLKPGTRIVSHAFHMEDWTPERHEVVGSSDIFLWTIPAPVEGLWRVTVPGNREFVLRIWQQFNRIQATATTVDEHSIPTVDTSLSGAEIRFTRTTQDGALTYTGTVEGSRMKGTSDVGEWTAERL